MLIPYVSEHAVAAIISREGHLVTYLSRKLTAAETNYSNIEKETLKNSVEHAKDAKRLISTESFT